MYTGNNYVAIFYARGLYRFRYSYIKLISSGILPNDSIESHSLSELRQEMRWRQNGRKHFQLMYVRSDMHPYDASHIQVAN